MKIPELSVNHPLDTSVIEHLLTDPHDLFLVWPAAEIPFDHEQWKDVLDPSMGNISFLIKLEGKMIGHAALRPNMQATVSPVTYTTPYPWVYRVSCIFLQKEYRGMGLGSSVINMIEEYAVQNLSAKKLELVVRTYNPGAIACYNKCGFHEIQREDTLITMEKVMEHE